MKLLLIIATACVGLAVMARAGEAVGDTGDSLFSNIWAVKIHVVNLNEALGFYTGLLEFDIQSRLHYPSAVILQNAGAHVVLVKCDSKTAFDPDVGTRFNLNLYVEDLDGFVERMRAAGVTVLDDVPLKAGVGRYVRILDPSGNQLHIMELGYEHEPVSKPTVYNVGTRITDMKKSRSFYEGLLGFDVFSEKYYPPVIPYKVRGIQVILHEGGKTVTRPVYPDGSQTILTLLTSDLDAALNRLRSEKVEPLLPNDIDGPTGRYNAVRDPDGNVIELLELD